MSKKLNNTSCGISTSLLELLEPSMTVEKPTASELHQLVAATSLVEIIQQMEAKIKGRISSFSAVFHATYCLQGVACFDEGIAFIKHANFDRSFESALSHSLHNPMKRHMRSHTFCQPVG